MKRKVWRYLVLGAFVCLLVWGLWYHRPVGVEVLFPGLEIDRVEVTLLRAIPALSRSVPGGELSGEDEVQHRYLAFAGETERFGELFFYMGHWRYLDSAAGNTQLTLSMTDGKAVGQALAGELWELAG